MALDVLTRLRAHTSLIGPKFLDLDTLTLIGNPENTQFGQGCGASPGR